eukprot:403369589
MFFYNIAQKKIYTNNVAQIDQVNCKLKMFIILPNGDQYNTGLYSIEQDSRGNYYFLVQTEPTISVPEKYTAIVQVTDPNAQPIFQKEFQFIMMPKEQPGTDIYYAYPINDWVIVVSGYQTDFYQPFIDFCITPSDPRCMSPMIYTIDDAQDYLETLNLFVDLPNSVLKAVIDSSQPQLYVNNLIYANMWISDPYHERAQFEIMYVNCCAAVKLPEPVNLEIIHILGEPQTPFTVQLFTVDSLSPIANDCVIRQHKIKNDKNNLIIYPSGSNTAVHIVSYIMNQFEEPNLPDTINYTLESNLCSQKIYEFKATIINCTKPGVVQAAPSISRNYVIGQPSFVIKFDQFTSDYPECIEKPYKFEILKDNLPIDYIESEFTFIVLDRNLGQVNLTKSENEDYKAQYKFTMTMEGQALYQQIVIEVLELGICISNYSYNYCEKMKNFTFLNLTMPACERVGSVDIMPFKSNPNDRGAIKFNELSQNMSVYSCDYFAMKEYFFTLSAPNSSLTYTWKIVLNGYPQCGVSQKQSDTEIRLNAKQGAYKWSFQSSVPNYEICDYAPRNYILVDSAGQKANSNFFSFNSKSQTITFNVGKSLFPYNQDIYLYLYWDRYSQTKTQIKLYVKYEAPIIKQNANDPKPVAEQIQDMKAFDFSVLNSSDFQSNLGLNKSNQPQFINATIKSISQEGEVVIQFSEKLRFKDSKYYGDIRDKGLVLRLWQNYYNTEYEDVDIRNWTITNIDDYYVYIQLYFTDTPFVSKSVCKINSKYIIIIYRAMMCFHFGQSINFISFLRI